MPDHLDGRIGIVLDHLEQLAERGLRIRTEVGFVEVEEHVLRDGQDGAHISLAALVLGDDLADSDLGRGGDLGATLDLELGDDRRPRLHIRDGVDPMFSRRSGPRA